MYILFYKRTYLYTYLSNSIYTNIYIYYLSLYLSVALFVLFYIVYAYVCMCCQHIHAQYIYLYIPIYNIYSSMLSLLRYFALNNYKYNRKKTPTNVFSNAKRVSSPTASTPHKQVKRLAACCRYFNTTLTNEKKNILLFGFVNNKRTRARYQLQCNTN